MADQQTHPSIAALRKLEASLQLDLLEREARTRAAPTALPTASCSWRSHFDQTHWQLYVADWWVRLRKLTFVAAAIACVIVVGIAALWWRLGNGPISFDVATPWLTAAIEENFGANHQVEVGGAQIERDSTGRTALRIRDIVVRAPDGAIVASAPKAEVGVSSSGLMTGRVRAERLSLVGAEMQVRIEQDSKVTVFAGSNKRPFVTASAASTPVRGSLSGSAPLLATVEHTGSTPAANGSRSMAPDLTALLAWIDGLGATGLDGHDLSELGLKNGNLTVDDQRNGKQWTFHDISLSLTRPQAGSVVLTVSSESPERPWMLRAALAAAEHGHRTVDIETKKLPARDLLLAMRVGEGKYEPDLPVSARIRADIGPDGTPRMVDGRIVVDKGLILDADDPSSPIAIDHAELSLEWDSARQALVVPFQIVSGGNRVTSVAQLDPPREGGGGWAFKVTGGTVMLAATASDPNPLVLNRLALRLRVDPERQRVEIEQGDIGNSEVGIALTGGIDLANGDPRLSVGVASNRMSVAAMKRLWPAVISPNVRSWVDEHILSGTVERLVIATNAPLSNLKAGGPPVPDDGLSIEIAGNGAEIRPVEGLPSIRDADINLKISGRNVTLNVGRGNVELSAGRKLVLTNGVFEVPDTEAKPLAARVRYRVEGPIPAAAELLALDRLREYSGAPLDPATSRGTLAAQVQLGFPLQPNLPPGSTQYTINMDVANLSADKLVMGQKVEANTLRVSANNQGFYIRGDVKINGVPAALDYRKPRGDADAEVRLTATLDDGARSKLGFDLGAFVSGPAPVKINGRISAEGEGRYAVEADLSQTRIDKLFPGWIKPAGRAAKTSFTLVTRPQVTRIDDLVVESAGTSVKGSIELNDAGDLVSANLPAFNLSDGDKATLKADRASDGSLRVTMRGEVYDGRSFIKSAMAGPSADQARQSIKDIDIEIKFGTVAGFNGETLRSLDLRMSRRGGAIKSFAMNAKLGREATILGDMRGKAGGRSVLYVESGDAGAFFRFSDTYSKVFGGEMWVAMDPPTGDQLAPQDGILNVRDFTVRGEAALEKIAAGAVPPPGTPNTQRPGVEFSRMRIEFTKSLGRISIREGIVKGPSIGATTEGFIDYLQNDVRMRGTFVPFYGINNMFGQIPIFGLFLGGGNNEGLVGLTYEVVGTPGAPVLRVNPISVVAPGMIRKFFEFPSGNRPQSFADPFR